MTEIPGSDSLLERIAFYLWPAHEVLLYRKTTDAEGDDYYLILNGTGDELAEWDEGEQNWIVVNPPVVLAMPQIQSSLLRCLPGLSSKLSEWLCAGGSLVYSFHLSQKNQ
ncbi:hypothetical protein [Kosakonia sp. YIM B13611]|uniref:hypothetical protein n=1 Tax=unclassified Kosakonia TaxID=2632876 RepID=UPI00367B73DF